MTQVGKWSRRIGGGALVLALVGLLAPATTSARYMEEEEVIEVEGEAPLTSPWWHGGYTGGGGSSSGSSADGVDYGGGIVDGTSEFSRRQAAAVQQIMSDCAEFGGSYTVSEHYEFDTNENVVDSWFYTECYIETQHGWMLVRYDPENGHADPVEICSGSPGQPGTCFEP
jgi:hypothetical protein